MIDLQTFVFVMVSICLFSQFDDFVDIELSHFEQKLFVFDSYGNIQALCIRVYGKSDAGWTHLFLWNDEECPEFVLFLYCYALRIVQVSKVGSYFKAKRNSNLPQTMEYL